MQHRFKVLGIALALAALRPVAALDDTVPPGTVTTLAASAATATSAFLTWNAPGDDDFGGALVSGYDVRYSIAGPVTSATWASATPAVGEPLPTLPNYTQAMVVTGLAPGITHWFAVRAWDDAGLLSAVSNSPSLVVVASGDVTPPATISGLMTGARQPDGRLSLDWTPTGDDGATGIVAAYDIRLSTAGPLTEATFAGATAATVLRISHYWITEADISGIQAGTNYWFAVKAMDDCGNWSAMSNVAYLQQSDLLAPEAITDLKATSSKFTGITLTWTAPHEDGASGGAVLGYQVRYMTGGPITDQNWTAAKIWPAPAALAPGQKQTVVITGLTRGAIYSFGVKSYDDNDRNNQNYNWSLVSNSVNARYQ